MEQSENGRTLKPEETNLSAFKLSENEELTLPELVGQPTLFGLEEQPAFICEQPLNNQETDIGSSPSSNPVSELLINSQSSSLDRTV
ncbi:MAG: hypothetical protein GY861_29210, partial [bacterium]|nr:hypothetical protein [bacterium]